MLMAQLVLQGRLPTGIEEETGKSMVEFARAEELADDHTRDSAVFLSRKSLDET